MDACESAGALQGLCVVDLTRNVAGPYASKLLADQGAEVIKIEPPEGDPSRRFGPFPGDLSHPERSGLFLHLNRGKRSIQIDPASKEGAELVRDLAGKAMLVLEDHAPGQAQTWGWGYETLRKINPALVMTSITPFGQTGPYRMYRGSELTLQAIGGPLYTNGHQELEPLKLAGHFAHYHAGLMATLASLLALRRAQAVGHGDWVDLAVHECQAGCRDRQCMYVTVAGYTGMSTGRLRAAGLRMGAGVRACADGFVNIMGAANRLPRLLSLIGREDLANHPQLMAPTGTVPQTLVDEVECAYAEWLKTKSKVDAVAQAQAAGLLAAPLNTIADVLQADRFEVRGFWEQIHHPETGTLKYPGRPFLLSKNPHRAPSRAPMLDEHREQILAAAEARKRAALGTPAVPASAVDSKSLPLPLTGIRVAEITVVWAGPHVTQLLAEWGADVIRVEPSNKPQPYTRGMEEVPSRQQAETLAAQGIPTRLAGNDPGLDPWNRSAAFNSHARNKRSMACDIMSKEGREALLRLVACCDLLVENNVPQTMDKAGITWEMLHKVNPRLIWLRMPAFALEGPNRNDRAFGLHVEAMVGHTHLRGYPDKSPELLSESLASDGIAGVQGAVALMMALRHRDRTGEGQLIEMPLTEGFLPTLGEFIMDYSMNGHDSPTQGNRHPSHAPHNVYRCRGDDEWVAIDVATDVEFTALCNVLGQPALANDTRFAAAQSRFANQLALDEVLDGLTKVWCKERLFHALQTAGVCAAPVRKALEVLNDPQLLERGFFESLPTGDNRVQYPYPGLSFRMTRTPNQLRTGPVRLGEHNQEIYCDLLGYSFSELQEMMDQGLVSTRYPSSVWKPQVSDGSSDS